MDHGVMAHAPSEHDEATENHCRGWMFRYAERHSLWCMYAYMYFQQYGDKYMYNHNQPLQVLLAQLKVFFQLEMEPLEQEITHGQRFRSIR